MTNWSRRFLHKPERFSTALIAGVVVIILAFSAASSVHAQDALNSAVQNAGADAVKNLAAPKLQIPIPELTLTNAVQKDSTITIPYLGQYVAGVYKFLISIVGLLASVMIMVGGFQYLTAGGDKTKVEAGKKRIVGALTGMVIALGSYVLLFTINPDLVNFKAFQILAVKTEIFTDREAAITEDADSVAGGGDGPEEAPGPVTTPPPKTSSPQGKGDKDAADLMSCPNLTAGTQFTGAFTTYYDISSKLYGQAGNYNGIYKGSNSPELKGLADFFCAVNMECGCPKGQFKTEGKSCDNGRKQWYPCNYFDKDTKYCTPKGRAGQTIAASTCFPRHCKLTVNGHTLEVTDRGSGIIGTHFDFYLGVKGETGYPADTSWLSPQITVGDCPGTVSSGEKNRMQAAYEHYKAGVCKPGVNC